MAEGHPAHRVPSKFMTAVSACQWRERNTPARAACRLHFPLQIHDSAPRQCRYGPGRRDARRRLRLYLRPSHTI
jgi:hypothetical protein